MNFPTLSAHAEEFLALKRAVAKVDPHRNTQDRRSVKHREKAPSEFCCLLARSRMSVADPVRFAC